MNTPVRLAYLGPVGTNTEEAARIYFPGKGQRGEPDRGTSNAPLQRQAEFVPLPAVPDIMWAAQRGDVDEGVVPIENSLEGAVAVTLDMLAHEVDLNIRAEVVLPIHHALLVHPSIGKGNIGDIEAVYSHPQALAQCRKQLDRLLPRARRIPTSSTAEAARRIASSGVKTSSRSVKDGDPGAAAAIATRLAGEIYGLTVFAADMQDRADNATRFVVVGRGDAPPTGRDKSSIVVGGRADRPGVLSRILQSFAERNINLTRIESRPAKRTLGEYLFFIDLEGHREDPAVREALGKVQEQCDVFRVLGSYPAWRQGGESSGDFRDF